MEWFITEDGKYRIESLSAATFPGALNVINIAFFQDETVCTGTEVNKNPKACEELLELCADAVLDGVSMVAVEISSGEVVATSINKLQVSTQDPSEKPFFEVFAEERCKHPSSKALIQFMATVDGQCNLFEKYNAECSLELMFLATLREHRRKKLAYILCRESIELGKKLKNGPVATISREDLGIYSSMPPRAPITKVPTICQMIGTSEGTQRIGKALNFTVYYCSSFRNFMYEGKSYVDRLGEEVNCEVIARPLDI